MRIIVFGDSVSWGSDDKEGGGWVDRLKIFILQFLSTKTGRFEEVFNFGNPGILVPDVLDYLESCCENWLGTAPKYKKVNGIIIAIGTNDCVTWKNKKTRTSPELFKSTMHKIIKLSKKYVNKIAVVGLTPVNELITTPVPWNREYCYKNSNIEKYDQIIKSVCEEENVYFVDVRSEWVKTDYKNLLSDGLHPNTEGHKKIFEQVRDFLVKNKLIDVS